MKHARRASWIGVLAAGAALTACDEEAAVDPAEEPAGYTIEAPPLADRPVDSLLSGTFVAYGDYIGIAGRAQLYRQSDGQTVVQIYADGLQPGVTYPAHVHAWPCDIGQGGAHYKIDPAIEDIVPENELWPVVTANGSGVAVATLTAAHIARGDAQSVILHDPMNDNTKMVCADLRAPGYPAAYATGVFAPFAYASEADGPIDGTTTMTVNDAGTTIEVAVDGLRPDQLYAAHLHALPCHVGDGGGHYKIDPTVEDTVESNELWPLVEPAGDGTATYTLQSPHPVRATAQSIVIHRVTADGAPKVACADLVRDDYPALELEGRSTPLPVALERGYDQLRAEASLTRSLDGTTRGFIGVQGVNPGERYTVHLHAYRCAVEAGGGHYKIDPAVDGPIPSNELWLDFTADASGNGLAQASIAHLARPDATSYVIHDSAEDGARIACIDLR